MDSTAVTLTDSASVDFEMPSPGTPGYEEFRKTGKLPDVEPKEEAAKEHVEEEIEPSEKAESATAKPAVNAPVSAPGRQQGKKKTGDERFQELANRNRELQERLDALERRTPQSEVKRDVAASPAVTEKSEVKVDGEPELGGINPETGKNFLTVAEWQKAHTAWLRGQILSEVRGDLTKSEQQRVQQERERADNEGLAQKLVVGKDKYADFDKVAFNPDLVLPKGSAADIFVRQAENPADLLYYLGQHPEVLKSFYRYVPGKDDQPGKLTGQFEQLIHPSLQMMELAKIEVRLGSASKPATKLPAQTITQAPRTPHQVGGKSPTPDPLARAVDEGDQGEFTRLENERLLAKRKASSGRR